MTRETLLDVRGLSLSIDTDEGTLEALSDITFTLEKGETFALVGESGCGKSLTAASLMRLLPENARVTAGEIRLDGRELLSLTEREMRGVRGAKIAMVFQESSTALDPVMTVGDQLVEMIQAHRTVSSADAKKEALEWLERVGVSLGGDALSRYPHELSGGQKQRVMIAMALSARPDVVIADEPTTALDVTLQAQILKLLKDLQKETRLTLLLITHDLAVVKQTADRLALMYAGEIVETATVADFFSSPRHPYAGALLNALPDADRKKTLHPIDGTVPTLAPPPPGCRFRARCPRATEACARHPDLTGDLHPVRCLFPGKNAAETGEERFSTAPRESRPTVLEISNLTVTYGTPRWWRPDTAKPAVRGVSLTLSEGETLALVGESGSGKTTAVMAALGLLGPKARVTGSVRLLGRDVLGASGENLRLLRQTAQIIFQDPFSSLDPRMTVRETLEEGMIALHPEWSSEERLERVRKLLRETGLPENAAERLPHAFSGGQRQRIAIARALSVEPRIIVCDEPTSALDVSVQAQILNLLSRLQKSFGLSYLFITHNFGVVRHVADRIAVMRAGEIVEEGEADRIFSAPLTDYTLGLLAAIPRL